MLFLESSSSQPETCLKESLNARRRDLLQQCRLVLEADEEEKRSKSSRRSQSSRYSAIVETELAKAELEHTKQIIELQLQQLEIANKIKIEVELKLKRAEIRSSARSDKAIS